MMLSRKDILKLVEEKGMIEPFELECLESAGYDLRVDGFFRTEGNAHLGKTKADRKLPEIKEVESDIITLQPGDYILISTLESVNMPLDIAAFVLNRSSVFRSGCTTVNALVDPGYKGTLTFGLKNISDHDFSIEKGARVSQIVFMKLDGETLGYAGRYQGGKVV